MKAAYLREIKNVKYEDVPKPQLGAEEALIKVEYAGICGSDVHVYLGHHPTAKYPVIPGHEFSGELVEINSAKPTDLKVGDKVVAQPLTGCNTCDICIQGRDNVCPELKIFGIHDNGCFAEFIKVPLRKVYKIPKDCDMKLAALTEPLAVAMHDVRRSNLKVGQTVFVSGGGPIGLLVAIVARMNGASQIVISEINKNRINFIKDMGFDIINPMECDPVAEVARLTQKKGFDVVFEASGVKPGIEMALKSAKIGGTIVMIGIPNGSYSLDVGPIIYEELDIKGVRIHAQINFAAAVEIIRKGTINDQLSKLITNVFSLRDIQEAMKFAIEDKDHFKIVLKVE